MNTALTRFLLAAVLFALVFCYPWEMQKDWENMQPITAAEYPWQARKNWQGHGYFLFSASEWFIVFRAWLDPWKSHRSLGYPAFLYPFLYPHQQKFREALTEAYKAGTSIWGKEVDTIAAQTGIAGGLENAALVQRCMAALAVGLFFLSLCRWYSPIFSFVALLAALCLVPPPDPQFIMVEAVSSPLTWFCGAFLLFAPKSKRKGACFALACLCASLAYLVRPQALSLTGFCSLVFLCQFFADVKKRSLTALLRTGLAFCPLLIAYGYIGWLSVTAGQLSLHTHPTIPFSTFAYFAESEDVPFMPTERAKKFTAWYGEHKKEFLEIIDKRPGGIFANFHLTEHDSPPRSRLVLGDLLVYRIGMPDAWRHFKNEPGIGGLSIREKHIFGRELNSGLRKRHMGEMLVIRWQNFLGALGYYGDVWHLKHFSRATFAITMAALLLTGAAMACCGAPRWPLAVMAGIHLMALLAAALGHVVIRRYIEPTETLLLLAGICSLSVLASGIRRRWQGRPSRGALQGRRGVGYAGA